MENSRTIEGACGNISIKKFLGQSEEELLKNFLKELLNKSCLIPIEISVDILKNI